MIKEKLANVQKILVASSDLARSIKLSQYKDIMSHSFLICTVPSEREGTHCIAYNDGVGRLPFILDGVYVYDIYLGFYEHFEWTTMELFQSFRIKKCSVQKSDIFIRPEHVAEIEDLENIENVFCYWKAARNFYEDINRLKRIPERYFYLDDTRQIIDTTRLKCGNFSYNLYPPEPHRVLFKCINDLDLNWKDIFHTLVIKLFKRFDERITKVKKDALFELVCASL